jgi:hypothetical protein
MLLGATLHCEVYFFITFTVADGTLFKCLSLEECESEGRLDRDAWDNRTDVDLDAEGW